MELNLIRLLCLIGFVSVALTNELGPLLIKQQLTWSKAQRYCRENFVDLFTISSSSDQVKLNEEKNKKSGTGSVWTGLNIDLNSWYWSYNHLPLTNTSLNVWNNGYPSDEYGEQLCGLMYAAGYWGNCPCNYFGPYICYDVNNNYANRFVAYPAAEITWLQAQTFCRQYHTDLASVLTLSDVSLLKQILPPLNIYNCWIGLIRNTWMWSDGSNASYLPWLNGQPDNFNKYEYCATEQGGLLSDEDCTNLHYFICAAKIVRKQTVKLQVQSKDLPDSAVQSSILEMIKQKLQEKGMLVNTKVTWKVQADGNIFYKKAKNIKP